MNNLKDAETQIHKSDIVPGEYSAYLFDADGTLIDTVELILRSFKHILEVFADRLERKPAQEEIIAKIGLPLRRQMEECFGPLSDNDYERIHSVYAACQLEHYKDYVRLFPHVRETLTCLRKKNRRLGIVSSRKMDSLGEYLKFTGIADFFDCIVTPEKTEAHKPSPQPVLEALKLLGTESGRTVLVGDSLFDIQAGAAAGVDTVFVNWSRNIISGWTVRPDYRINSMRALCGPE